MTFVVTEACIRCKYTDCVDVCPVECFHEGPDLLVIDPGECIDCAVCVPECPVNAIYAEAEVPDAQRAFIALNARLASAWPVLRMSKAAHREAQQWNGKPGKVSLLEDATGDVPPERAA